MKKLRKEIIQTLYDSWADGDYPGTKPDVPEVREAINGITARCHAAGTDALYIESTINAAMCTREEAAFTAGERKIFCVYGKNSSLIRNRYV